MKENSPASNKVFPADRKKPRLLKNGVGLLINIQLLLW